MRHIIIVFLGGLLVACGGTKVNQSTVLNPNNPKGVKGSVVKNKVTRAVYE